MLDQVSREGFVGTEIEPTGVGFGAFEELGAAVLAMAAGDGVVPTIARRKAMEHIDAPDVAMARVSVVLSPGGSHRFLCPKCPVPL